MGESQSIRHTLVAAVPRTPIASISAVVLVPTVGTLRAQLDHTDYTLPVGPNGVVDPTCNVLVALPTSTESKAH